METPPPLSFEDKVLVSDLPRIMRDADPETRIKYWKIIDSIFHFIRRSQAQSPGHDSSEITYPPASQYTEIITNAEEVVTLVHEYGDFTIGSYNYLVLMAQADSLEPSMASLGQTREIIASLPALSQVPKTPMEPGSFNSPFTNEFDFLAAKKWSEKQYKQNLAADIGEDDLAHGCRDVPQDCNDLRNKAEELGNAALSEDNIIDRMWHGRGENRKLSFVIKRKRAMSVLDLSLVGWEAVIALRDCQMGIPNVLQSANDFEYCIYNSFTERFDDLKELFTTSKAAVINNLTTSSLIRSAAQPYRALKNKIMNKNTNSKREDEIHAGRTVLAQQQQSAAATAGTGTATSSDREASESEPEASSSDDGEEDDELNKKENIDSEVPTPASEGDIGSYDGQAEMEQDDYNLDVNRNLVVRYLVSQGVEEPADENFDARDAYMDLVQQLLGDADFVEVLQADAVVANGGVDGEHEQVEENIDA